MLRALFTAICTLEVVAPARLIAGAQRLALDNPDDCDLRSWVLPVARLEGVAILWSLWRSEESYSSLKRFLGLVGVLALLFPRAYVDYGGNAAYTADSDPEWRPWVYTGTRLVGLTYVLIALGERRNRS